MGVGHACMGIQCKCLQSKLEVHLKYGFDPQMNMVHLARVVSGPKPHARSTYIVTNGSSCGKMVAAN
jgi:hypothetical protein